MKYVTPNCLKIFRQISIFFRIFFHFHQNYFYQKCFHQKFVPFNVLDIYCIGENGSKLKVNAPNTTDTMDLMVTVPKTVSSMDLQQKSVGFSRVLFYSACYPHPTEKFHCTILDSIAPILWRGL